MTHTHTHKCDTTPGPVTRMTHSSCVVWRHSHKHMCCLKYIYTNTCVVWSMHMYSSCVVWRKIQKDEFVCLHTTRKRKSSHIQTTQDEFVFLERRIRLVLSECETRHVLSEVCICMTRFVHTCDMTHTCVQGPTCVAVWCSVLQCVACVAVWCSVMQCDAVCCSVWQCVAVCCSVLQCVTVCCSVSQCVAVCRSMLQSVAVCCSVLQSVSHDAHFIRVPWRIHMCDMSHLYVQHAYSYL